VPDQPTRGGFQGDAAVSRADFVRKAVAAWGALIGKPLFWAPVGIGKPSWPTPAGEFYGRNRLRGFKIVFYGPLAFGTSARSSVLTDRPAGGFVGIHSTDRRELLPGLVSRGCIS
jgi:lipoprotein-anchoring transpeptidase ErfK/SrfK